MSIPATYNIKHYQGDTFSLVFAMDGNLTAQTPLLQLRTDPSSGTVVVAASISSSYSGTTLKTTFTCTLTATQTAALTAGTVYYYDFQLTSGATVTTYIRGNFGVIAEVSR
jgi:hypothetical protein